jgi:hypothetical protein
MGGGSLFSPNMHMDTAHDPKPHTQTHILDHTLAHVPVRTSLIPMPPPIMTVSCRAMGSPKLDPCFAWEVGEAD